MEVEVVKFYPFEIPSRRGGLVGYADVQVGDILIRGVRLFRNRYGGYYVQMPTLHLGDRNYPVVEIRSKDLVERIRKKVVDLYRQRV